MILRKNSKILTHNGKKLSFTPEIFPAGVTTQLVTRQLKSGNDYYPLSLQVREVVIDPILQNNNWATIEYVIHHHPQKASVWIMQTKEDINGITCRLMGLYSAEIAAYKGYGGRSLWALETGLPDGTKTVKGVAYDLGAELDDGDIVDIPIYRGDHGYGVAMLPYMYLGNYRQVPQLVLETDNWNYAKTYFADNFTKFSSVGMTLLYGDGVKIIPSTIRKYLGSLVVGSQEFRAVLKQSSCECEAIQGDGTAMAHGDNWDSVYFLPSIEELSLYPQSIYETIAQSAYPYQYNQLATRDIGHFSEEYDYNYPLYRDNYYSGRNRWNNTLALTVGSNDGVGVPERSTDLSRYGSENEFQKIIPMFSI